MRLTDPQLWDRSPELQAKGPRPVDRPKRKMSREESQMQISFVKWWQVNCRVFGVPELCLFSIPNGGGRSGPIVGSILKAEGLRKGAPDLFLAAPRMNRMVLHLTPMGAHAERREFNHGLFLELKRREGVVSPEQEVYHDLLRKQGYAVNVCRTLNECISVTTTYLTR